MAKVSSSGRALPREKLPMTTAKNTWREGVGEKSITSTFTPGGQVQRFYSWLTMEVLIVAGQLYAGYATPTSTSGFTLAVARVNCVYPPRECGIPHPLLVSQSRQSAHHYVYVLSANKPSLTWLSVYFGSPNEHWVYTGDRYGLTVWTLFTPLIYNSPFSVTI